MADFTPGPWFNKGSLRLITARSALGGIVIADVVKTDGLTDAEADANARLISSAPNLIDALKALMRFEPYFAGEPEWNAARAAITAATGGE